MVEVVAEVVVPEVSVPAVPEAQVAMASPAEIATWGTLAWQLQPTVGAVEAVEVQVARVAQSLS